MIVITGTLCADGLAEEALLAAIENLDNYTHYHYEYTEPIIGGPVKVAGNMKNIPIDAEADVYYIHTHHLPSILTANFSEEDYKNLGMESDPIEGVEPKLVEGLYLAIPRIDKKIAGQDAISTSILKYADEKNKPEESNSSAVTNVAVLSELDNLQIFLAEVAENGFNSFNKVRTDYDLGYDVLQSDYYMDFLGDHTKEVYLKALQFFECEALKIREDEVFNSADEAAKAWTWKYARASFSMHV